ncbi:MAG: hypothetical protein ACKPKO_64485, partial [Candidatus Fonsibacter sp.]
KSWVGPAIWQAPRSVSGRIVGHAIWHDRLAFVSLDPHRCRMVPSDVLQAATGFKKIRET